jgi:hypothetical protein
MEVSPRYQGTLGIVKKEKNGQTTILPFISKLKSNSATESIEHQDPPINLVTQNQINLQTEQGTLRIYFEGKMITSTSEVYEATPEYLENIKNETRLPNIQQATSNESGENMDDGFKKLIDRIDQDVRDHKKESRDRDAALSKHMEDLISSQQKLLDLKLTNLDTKLTNMDQNIGHIRTEMTTITQRVDSVHGRVDSTKYFIVGAVITILLGIGGIVYANWQVIGAMIQIAKTK